MFTQTYFYLGSATIGLLFFLSAKTITRKFLPNNKALPIFLLTSSFLIWGLALMESALKFSMKGFQPPPAPKLLISYRANTHVLIKNSILYVNPPNQTFKSFGHNFKTNSLGFRERNFKFKKNKQTFRILILGSSLTFGVGIDSDHRYSNLLELMLNEQYPEKTFEILNFGMAAYNYDQEYDLLKAILNNIDCDLVVIGIPGDYLMMTTKKMLINFTKIGNVLSLQQINDFDPNGFFSNSKRNLTTIPFNEPAAFIRIPGWYESLRLFQVIEKRTRLNDNQLIPNQSRLNYAIDQWQGILKLIETKKLPRPIAVLLYRGTVDPKQNNFVNPSGDIAKNVKLLKFLSRKLAKEGFQIADPLPLFEHYSGMSMAISEWEKHPNYLAHYIYAKTLFDTLAKIRF